MQQRCKYIDVRVAADRLQIGGLDRDHGDVARDLDGTTGQLAGARQRAAQLRKTSGEFAALNVGSLPGKSNDAQQRQQGPRNAGSLRARPAWPWLRAQERREQRSIA